MARKGQRPMMLCGMPLHSSWEMLVNMLCVSRPTFFHFLPPNPHTSQSTLCFWLMTLILCVALFWGWPQQWWLKQKKDSMKINTLQTCLFFSLLRFLGVYINKLIIFFIIMLAWHELQKALEVPPLLILYAFYKQRVSVMLQWEQAPSISRQAIGKDNSIGLETWSPSHCTPSITRKDKSICLNTNLSITFFFFALEHGWHSSHQRFRDLAWRTMIPQKKKALMARQVSTKLSKW